MAINVFKNFKKKFKNNKEIESQNLIPKIISNDDFINEMKEKYSYTQDEKNEQMFNLFRQGKIKEEELTSEQKEILTELYMKHIKNEASKIKKLLNKIKNI